MFCYSPVCWLYTASQIRITNTRYYLPSHTFVFFARAATQLMSWAYLPLRNVFYISHSNVLVAVTGDGGSAGGHIRHPVRVWCGTDMTGNVVVWREDTAVHRREGRDTKRARQYTKQQMCAGEWPWQCCDVIWDVAASKVWTGCRWCDMIWCQEDTWGGDWTKALLYSHSTLSLYLSFSHARTQTSAVGTIHRRLPRSVNLICPTMLPPTSPRSLILSRPFSIPLSFIFFVAPALSCFLPASRVCHAVQSSGHGCGSRPNGLIKIGL